MTKAHSGFAAGGVQQHSAGEHFPITEYTCGGWPPNDDEAYYVVQAPCGVKRRCWNESTKVRLLETFSLAQEFVNELDTNVVDEVTAFEIALNALGKKDHETGFSFTEK